MDAGQEKTAQSHIGEELQKLDKLICEARALAQLSDSPSVENEPRSSDLGGVLNVHIAHVRRLQAELRPVIDMLSVLRDALA